MLNKMLVFYQTACRQFSRSEWAVKLLRLSLSGVPHAAPGLVMIQIDGLSREQLERAQKNGRLPFLERLLGKEHYKTHTLYTGLPSSTPAVQGELFYGVKGCVPEFSFRDKESGKIFKMYEPASAVTVEGRLRQKGKGLLEGGSSYSNIFTGGAAESHFCAADLGLDHFFRAVNPLVFPILFFLYLDIFLRTAVLLIIEFFLAVWDCIRGTVNGRHFFRELTFIPTRVVTCILFRELIVAGAAIDMARGLPIIHLNLIGYDEQAHRRGPSSVFAHWSLRGIDHAIERLWSSAHQSARRDYDVWVYSDHGQESNLSYTKIHGVSVQEAFDDILGEKTIGERIIAMGPVGIAYLPHPLEAAEMEKLALKLVETAGIPHVLKADGPGRATVWSKEGRWTLPDQAEAVFGADHPFLEDIAEDMVRLCHHPDAGDCVFLGWKRDGSVTSFMLENGTHAGPGVRETGAFALLPQDAPVSFGGKKYLRPLDLREGVQCLLNRTSCAIFSKSGKSKTSPSHLRVMTYNVHSAVGMDGKIRPGRIARVIARHNPDVIALQELDVRLERTEGVDQVSQIAQELEMSYHFHPSYILEDGQYGNAILSRFPMKLMGVMGFPKSGKSLKEEPRGALWVAVDVGGTTLHFINTHLSIWPKERLAQAEVLCAEWLEKNKSTDPLILCGDFNASPDSPVYQRMTSLLMDAQKSPGRGQPQRTWFGSYPLTRIDHVFVNSLVEVTDVDVPRTRLERAASDHLPLIVEVRLPDLVFEGF